MASWSDGVLDRLRSPVLDAVADLPGVWVVGGAVRDVLLGRPVRELDLLVEGDAVRVARRLGEPDAVHERFGTVTVAGVDVVATRREVYPRPGALPEVALGVPVAEDLRRRDFSVNALAVRVADGHGEALDRALEDLEAGTLRVLHQHSFEDDPTRLVRMVRYAARLGFAVDPDTTELARAAVRGGALRTISGSRLGGEVRRLLEEPLPAALVELDRWEIGQRAIHPAFTADAQLIEDVVASTPEGALAGLAALGACLLDADADAHAVALALGALSFPAAERAIVAAASAGRTLAAALRVATSPSDVAGVAARQPAEALAVAAALGAAEPVDRWLHEWRHVRLAITGEDLLDAGLRGPAIGTGLRAAHAAALDGDAGDRETQLAIAVEAGR